jgi:cystathionine beta-lyase/cystathionine gamma-synthase
MFLIFIDYRLFRFFHVVLFDDFFCLSCHVYPFFSSFSSRVAHVSNKMDFSFVDMNQLSNLESAITPKTKLVWVETPTNPTLKLADIGAIAEICKKHKLILVVDNTFATPYLQQPLQLGADIVVHSVTK